MSGIGCSLTVRPLQHGLATPVSDSDRDSDDVRVLRFSNLVMGSEALLEHLQAFDECGLAHGDCDLSAAHRYPCHHHLQVEVASSSFPCTGGAVAWCRMNPPD